MDELKIKTPVDPKNPNYYVNNADFYHALKDYRALCDKAKEEGKEQPIIPDYIGRCFLAIAAGISIKHNFRNYSYIKDMQSAAVEVCIKRVLSFDPDKGNMPFSYFTQVVWFAFLNIIKTEKKQSDIKRRAFLLGGFDTFDIQDQDESGEFRIQYNDYINSFGDDDKELLTMKPKKSKKGALDSFLEE